jgi:DNA-binding HxlR family transcriptional regulator
MHKQAAPVLYRPCHVERTIELFSGRWKSAIIYHLRKEPVRFNELQRQIPFISQRMLTYQLRRLETDGLVLRVDHQEKQPRVVYSLTPAGHSLGDVVLAVHKWGKRNESLLASPTVENPKA